MSIKIRKSINLSPKAAQYIMEPQLAQAVEMALLFNQPLLLTGEPGTGKTQLAYKVAHDLAEQTKGNSDGPIFDDQPLRFNTKTTTAAKDLFYTYDAVGHFQAANMKKGEESTLATKDFIELQALGLAIAKANPQSAYQERFKWKMPEKSLSSVVLIDEVDKAPRDFSNDLLNELERYEFFIKEQDNYGLNLGENNDQRILVIMTSNSEKNLPDAFLRRCVFYHIPFPNETKLRQIIEAQLLADLNENGKANLNEITDLFQKIRSAAVRKKPATAELLAFIKILEMDELLNQPKGQVKDWYLKNLSLLVKTKEDRKAIEQFLNK